MLGTVLSQMRKLRQRGVRDHAQDCIVVDWWVYGWHQDLSVGVHHLLPQLPILLLCLG